MSHSGHNGDQKHHTHNNQKSSQNEVHHDSSGSSKGPTTSATSDSEVVQYKKSLTSFLTKANRIPKKDAAWTKTMGFVNEAVLRDAYEETPKVEAWLRQVLKTAPKSKAFATLELVSRPQIKLLRRVKEKLKPTDRDPEEAYYRAQTDWIAFRLYCTKPEDIPTIFDLLQNAVEHPKDNKHKGIMRYRCHPIGRLGEMTDMTVNCDVFLPQFGYMVEVQIGIRFAFFLYSRRSELRETPTKADHLPDYFGNKGEFYTLVKERTTSQHSIVKEELEKLWATFEARNWKTIRLETYLKEREKVATMLKPWLPSKYKPPVSKDLRKRIEQELGVTDQRKRPAWLENYAYTTASGVK